MERQKWEYCRLAVDNVAQPGSPIVTSVTDGVLARSTVNTYEALDKWLKYLGDDGWELVGLLANADKLANTDKGQLLFRRPAE